MRLTICIIYHLYLKFLTNFRQNQLGTITSNILTNLSGVCVQGDNNRELTLARDMNIQYNTFTIYHLHLAPKERYTMTMCTSNRQTNQSILTLYIKRICRPNYNSDEMVSARTGAVNASCRHDCIQCLMYFFLCIYLFI